MASPLKSLTETLLDIKFRADPVSQRDAEIKEFFKPLIPCFRSMSTISYRIKEIIGLFDLGGPKRIRNRLYTPAIILNLDGYMVEFMEWLSRERLIYMGQSLGMIADSSGNALRTCYEMKTRLLGKEHILVSSCFCSDIATKDQVLELVNDMSVDVSNALAISCDLKKDLHESPPKHISPASARDETSRIKEHCIFLERRIGYVEVCINEWFSEFDAYLEEKPKKPKNWMSRLFS